MSIDLVDSVRNLFTADVINRAATQLGEADANVQKAIHGLVPTVLTGILYQAGSDVGASNILNLSREAVQVAPPLAFGNTLYGNSNVFAQSTTDWGNSVFGEKTPGLAALVAAYAGIRESSALSLMNVVTPACYSVLGQHAGSTSLGPGGVVAYLHEQRDRVLSAVPAGIPVAGILGLPALADVGERLHRAHIAYARPASTTRVRGERRGAPVALILIILIIIAGLAWFFLAGKHDGSSQNSLTTSDTSTIPATDTVVKKTTVTTTESTDTLHH